MFSEKLAKLIDVKTIITLGVLGVFCYLSAVQVIKPDMFMIVVTAIITYFFTKKKDDEVIK